MELARCSREGDTAGLRGKAHALKGAAATLGAVAVQREAAALEVMARKPASGPALKAQSERVAEALDLLSASLAAVAPAADPVAEVAEVEVDTGVVTSALSSLAELLGLGETAAAELYERVRPQLLALFGVEGERLGEQIQGFDYEDAAAMVAALQENLAKRLQP